jgi:hypothetical protein
MDDDVTTYKQNIKKIEFTDTLLIRKPIKKQLLDFIMN